MQVYDGTKSNAMIAYEKYKNACFLLSGNKDDLPISYDDMLKYRPIYITRVPKNLDNKPDLGKDVRILNENFVLSSAGDNSSQFRSFYLKQAYIVFEFDNDGQVKISTINSKI